MVHGSLQERGREEIRARRSGKSPWCLCASSNLSSVLLPTTLPTLSFQGILGLAPPYLPEPYSLLFLLLVCRFMEANL